MKLKALCKKLAVPALVLCVAATWWCAAGLDSDSYYMIAEGRRLLAGGSLYENAWLLQGGTVVLQQWLYCIVMALAAKLPANLGLLILLLVQTAILYVLLARRTKNRIFAAVCMILISPTYVFSLRPETLTLILILLQCEALDAYFYRNRRVALLALPLLTLAESNLHASMLILHAAVLLAYVVRLPFPGVGERHRLTPELLVAALASVCTAFINPYGASAPAYIALTMRSFSFVPVIEQSPTSVASFAGLWTVLTAGAALWLAVKVRISSETLNLCLGFALVAAASFHGAMVLPVSAAFLAPWLPTVKPVKQISKYVKAACVAAYTLILIYAPVSVSVTLPLATFNKDIEPAAGYLLAHPAGNILNHMDCGPYLEYKGISRLFMDTRPEFLDIRMNGSRQSLTDFALFRYGAETKDTPEQPVDYAALLDELKIEYIVDTDDKPCFTALDGWLDTADGWNYVELDNGYHIWIRKGGIADA